MASIIGIQTICGMRSKQAAEVMIALHALAVGDRVTFTHEGIKHHGTVTSFTFTWPMAHVSVGDGRRYCMYLENLTYDPE